MLVEHKGQTMETKLYDESISEDFCNLMREQYYTKPSKDKVNNNLKKVATGGKKLTEIERYYFRDLMAKVKMHHSKWSIEEFLECDDLIKHAFGKIKSNDKVYDGTDIKNLETYFRLGGKGATAKPTNFPISTADEILKLYNVNNNYYDYSCGWGVRMLSALRNNINYYGTDPNYLLTERLEELHNDYDKVNGVNTFAKIYTQGSEIFISELEGQIGVAFSSPPYFGLEDYRVGEQSFKEGVTYAEWLEGYFTNTIKNIYKYLVDDGYLILNINNYAKYKLVEDTTNICEQNGFEYVTTHELKNISRIKSTKELNTKNNEGIIVFKKVIDK